MPQVEFQTVSLGGRFTAKNVAYTKCSEQKAHKVDRKENEGPTRFKASELVDVEPVKSIEPVKTPETQKQESKSK